MNKQLATVAQWVDYIQGLHYRNIDLTLTRVREVYLKLFPKGVDFKVVSIAGSNGKGSTAELIRSIYQTAGYRVAKYTSPHLVSFNERYIVNGVLISDEELIEAFTEVEKARGSTRLTFFEFGTLVAIVLFSRAKVDLAVMEVGLGGRLDAVNILDSDVSVITSISIDHTNWLGDTVEKIAAEKIEIARANRPCIIGMHELPSSMHQFCEDNSVNVYQLGDHFKSSQSDQLSWNWQSLERNLKNIPLPFAQQGVQLINASLALMVAEVLYGNLPIKDDAIYAGIKNASLQARCQLVATKPSIVLDVAHNEASVQTLVEYLEKLNIQGKVVAVCGMLKDKQILQSLSCIFPIISEWHCASIHHERGATSEFIQSELLQVAENNKLQSFCYDSAQIAYNSALERLEKNDCLVVFGSFFIVGDIIASL